MTRWSAELRSLYDPRHLDHHAAAIERFAALAEEFTDADRPRVVEIGCNRGAYLVGLAQVHAPDRVLGLEWRPKYCAMAEERVAKYGVDNAIVLHGDARLAIPTLFAPESLDAVHVTFPDPWWKARHANRRVLDPLFMRVIARRLAPRGRLYLKSDVFEYLHRVRAFAQVSGAFRPLPAERWPDERAWAKTTRERKCMNSAIPFGRGYYERLDEFDTTLPQQPERAEDYAIDEDASEPTAVIKGPPPADIEARARAQAKRDERK